MSNLNKSYQWAIETCNAPNIGYSQDLRYQQVVNGITYYDCSSFIWYALREGEFPLTGSAFTTMTMRDILKSIGFTQKPITGEWLAGDILWRKGHTEMVYQGGQGRGITMGAHTGKKPLADQVSINTNESTASSWSEIYRYGEGGAEGYGYSIYVISAMAGNFWQESTLNPALWEGQTEGTWTQLLKGYGLGQWTNTGGDTHGRLYKLHEWLTTNGYAVDDGNAQVEYLMVEGTWYPDSAYQFRSLEEFLQSDSEDIEMLTHAWNKCWEGIHDSSWNARVGYARQCFEYIQEHANDTSIAEWKTGNRYLSNAERLNNAVMLYRALSAGGGGGGHPTPKPPHFRGGKVRMPIWLMAMRRRITWL